MVAEQVMNPDHQFVKEELAAEHETPLPEHDELDLTLRALGLFLIKGCSIGCIHIQSRLKSPVPSLRSRGLDGELKENV